MASTILIVDDSDDDVLTLRRLFAEAGVINPIRMVQDGNDAMRYLTGEPPFDDRADYPIPGILILDLKLPRRNGLEILEWLRYNLEFNDLAVFVAGGVDDPGALRLAYQLGAKSFLAKPCCAADVENLIRGFPKYWIRSTAAPIKPNLPLQP